MNGYNNTYVLIACFLYAVIYLCVAAITTRHNRIRGYRNEDDIVYRKKERRKE